MSFVKSEEREREGGEGLLLNKKIIQREREKIFLFLFLRNFFREIKKEESGKWRLNFGKIGKGDKFKIVHKI